MTRTPWLLPGAAAVAAAAALAGWRSRWRAAALWSGAGLAGYAASLQLVQAGPAVAYQHYLSPVEWIGRAPLPAAVLLAYLAAVAAGLWRRRDRLRGVLAGWRGLALALVAAAFVLTAATLSANPLAYAVELVVASIVQAAHLGAAALVALAVPPDGAAALDRAVQRVLGGSRAETPAAPPAADRVAWLAAAFAVVVPAVLAFLVYQRHPHVPDEVGYLLHARYLAAGRLFLPLPEPSAAFDVDLMFADGGRWYSPVPVGWPAVLALGVLAGSPWLVNPILNGVNVLLVHRLGRELYDRPTARLGAVLFAVSPWNLFLAMSLLTHTVSLTAALAAAAGVAAFRRGRPLGLMLPAGAAIGVVSLVRPLEGLIVAAGLGLWSLGARPWRRALAGGALLAAGAVLAGALTLPYNRALTGSAGRFPIMVYTDTLYGPGTNAMGFGPERGLGWSGLDPLPGHGPLDVLVNANLNLFALNVELLGWAAGSVLLLAWIAFGRKRPGDRLLLAAIGAVVGAHSFYWFAGGPDFGPRYWYLIAVPCVLLAARALLTMAGATADQMIRGRLAAGAAALALGALLVFIPWRAADKYHDYRGMEPGLRELGAGGRFGRDLVLVRGRRHPDYASAATLNPLDLTADAPIFAWDRSPEVRRAVIERYADRRVWLVDGPTVTGDGYRIVLGPVPAAELLQP